MTNFPHIIETISSATGKTESNWRAVECPYCEGTGEPYDGEKCAECEGTGRVVGEVEPITMEDLDHA